MKSRAENVIFAFIVGGMPAAVQKWLDSGDFFAVEDVQKNLISAYENDFSKHAPKSLVEKIRYVWNSIPSQLAKENKNLSLGLSAGVQVRAELKCEKLEVLQRPLFSFVGFANESVAVREECSRRYDQSSSVHLIRVRI